MDGGWNEGLLLLAGALTSAFAVVRLGMAQQKSLVEKLIGFLQSHGERQTASGERLADAVEALSERLGENTVAVRRLLDRAQINFGDGL